MPTEPPPPGKATRPHPPTPTNEHVHAASIVIDYSDDMAEEEGAPTSPSLQEQQQRQRRPDNPRCCTDPTPRALLQGWPKDKDKDVLERPRSSSGSSRSNQHRNRSPYSRSHLRSRSSGASSLSAPLMARAHSMPNPHMPRPFETVSSTPSSRCLSPSPLRSPARAGSPFKAEEGGYSPPPRSPHWLDTSSGSGPSIGIQVISEDSELDLTPRALPQQASSSSAPFSRSNSLRSSRRPSSPLYSSTTIQPSYSTTFPATVVDQNTPLNTSASNSPSLNPQKYNEAYPTSLSLHHYASNSSFSSSFSMPSTPTSARSRSPSISSLETIEDAPEEETEAEAEVIERLRLAADSESDGETEGTRRRSLDAPRSSRRIGLSIGGERKRWSISGGERRADLDLETIWED